MSDPSSYSHPELFKTNHVSIDWFVDFEKEIMKGHADLSMTALADDLSAVVLDSQDIDIKSVQLDGQALEFSISDTGADIGEGLTIQLADKKNKSDTFTLHIEYETSKTAAALQWMKPQQTLGKSHPFMYSQCQAINVRTILPCQDTPSDKFTYNAKVSVRNPLVVLMSAIEAKEKQESSDGITTYYFEQKVPIPSYLMAIVAGVLESRDIGPRSKVWAEPTMVEAAAYEFAETEQFISQAEKLAGDYVWKRYDLLVLPPTFPYGGMENPTLTFVNPAMVVGDRSLTHVVAHEISHSWTGNLVTNQSWEHFWLNEGWTRFLERKIVSAMYGEKAMQFHALGGLKDLQDSINSFGADNPLTKLVPDLSGGVHPEDSFSRVPYENGFTLLYYLQGQLGGAAVFEPYMRAYIDHFKYKSVTTNEWKEHLYQFFKDKTEVLNAVDWDAWLYSTGMPPVIPKYDDSLMVACVELSNRWSQSVDGSEFSENDIKDMSTKQQFEVVGELLQKDKVISARLFKKMDELYKLSTAPNVEIGCRMLQLGLRCHATEAIEPSIAFVLKHGREKYVRPLYRLLGGWKESREKTIAAFHENYLSMHPITAKNVMKDLKI